MGTSRSEETGLQRRFPGFGRGVFAVSADQGNSRGAIGVSLMGTAGLQIHNGIN